MTSEHNVNLAIIGNELIQFMIARRVGDNEFILSGLKRGCLGTEHFINHQNEQYQRFVLLNEKLHAVELPIHIYQNICKYRVLDADNEQYKYQKKIYFQWKLGVLIFLLVLMSSILHYRLMIRSSFNKFLH